MKNFFYPETICLVGASTKEKTIGYETLNTLKKHGYTGNVLPVNPKAEEILGYKCYHTIDEIDCKIDLAIIMVQKTFAEETVDKLLEKGVKSLILITAGFKEIGKEGEVIENRIIQKVKKAGARMVGPNCMGIICNHPDIKMSATFIPEKAEYGSMAFLSQSGAMGAAVLNSLRETDIRFAHFISVGNKADVNENDLLAFWQQDENIHAVTMYLESFVSGQEFIKLFAENKISKPVIILKAGRTKSGMKAASSHTGALGSSDGVVDAVLKQFGIIRAEDPAEMFDTSKGFENYPLPKGNRVAVVTNAGGPAILCVDAIDNQNLTLAELSPDTKQKLKLIIHPEGSAENPVDLLPGGTAEVYKSVVEILNEDENVDSIISIFVEPGLVKPLDVIDSINSVKSEKPIVQTVFPLPEFWEYYRHNSKFGKPVFRTAEQPAKVLSNLLFYKNRFERKGLVRLTKNENINGEDFLINGKINVAKVLRAYDIPVASEGYIPYEKLADYIFTEKAVVLKAICSKVSHKTEMNAVRLGITTREELLLNAEDMINTFQSKGFEIDTFLIQPFLKARHELLVGGFRDPSFGPMIMFGTGGKYVEAYNDTAMKSAYMNDDDVLEMIESTKIGKIIHGFRGEKGVDYEPIIKILKASAQMMIDLEFIKEFDFNPLIVTETGALFAVDVRIG